MRDLLIFLHDAPNQKYAVVIDDLSRLARDVEAYRALRRAISEAGGVLMSPSIKFGEASDSTLIENLLASVAQHQRQKNGEQTKNRMTVTDQASRLILACEALESTKADPVQNAFETLFRERGLP